MKSRRLIVPALLQQITLQQLQISLTGIEKKTKLVACESLYWINIHNNFKNTIKNARHVFFSRLHNQETNGYHMDT